MKLTLSIVLLLIAGTSFSQTDHNGNPVFNSVETSSETVKDFELSSNYYTLKNNIENKGSSVYISDRPTLDDVELAAINLPSDFFLIMKKGQVVNLVMLQNKPARQFMILDMQTQQPRVVSTKIEGAITENRANEIIKEGYDPMAKIVNGKLYFNKKNLPIITTKEIKRAVLNLINSEHLDTATSSSLVILSQEQTKAIVLEESKEGGKLDFFTEIKGHEFDGVLVKEGVFSTKLGVALYKWGRANFEIGVNTVDDALAIWAELKGRAPNQREKEYIKMGFNKDLEK